MPNLTRREWIDVAYLVVMALLLAAASAALLLALSSFVTVVRA